MIFKQLFLAQEHFLQTKLIQNPNVQNIKKKPKKPTELLVEVMTGGHKDQCCYLLSHAE